jgi:MoxR-like ATPase
MKARIQALLAQVNSVILDKEEQTKIIFSTWLMGGHVLLEDIPGTGKTVLAKAFSKVCNSNFGRVQFTPDLLPSDIIGITIYDQDSKKFYFRKGAIFSTFFLADEINRATPRTQAALLEAMAEKQITIENKTTELSKNFFVVATQNPIESHGTFPLPEAQLDRFTVRVSLGFLKPASEAKMIIDQLNGHPLTKVKILVSQEHLSEMKKEVESVQIDKDIISYILEIAQKTRNHKSIKHGTSPRATIAFTKLVRAYAYVSGRDHVLPADVYNLAIPVLNHRLTLSEDALFDGITTTEIISEIMKSMKPPKL